MQTILFCVENRKRGMDYALEGKGLKVNVNKTKVCSYFLERKKIF